MDNFPHLCPKCAESPFFFLKLSLQVWFWRLSNAISVASKTALYPYRLFWTVASRPCHWNEFYLKNLDLRLSTVRGESKSEKSGHSRLRGNREEDGPSPRQRPSAGSSHQNKKAPLSVVWGIKNGTPLKFSSTNIYLAPQSKIWEIWYWMTIMKGIHD